MQKISTMRGNAKNIFKGQLTIGLDLLCVLCFE